jgi:hypothetical protein
VKYCNIRGSKDVKRHIFLTLANVPGIVTAGESSGDAAAPDSDDDDDDDDCSAQVNLFRGLTFIQNIYIHKAFLGSKLPIKMHREIISFKFPSFTFIFPFLYPFLTFSSPLLSLLEQ